MSQSRKEVNALLATALIVGGVACEGAPKNPNQTVSPKPTAGATAYPTETSGVTVEPTKEELPSPTPEKVVFSSYKKVVVGENLLNDGKSVTPEQLFDLQVLLDNSYGGGEIFADPSGATPGAGSYESGFVTQVPAVLNDGAVFEKAIAGVSIYNKDGEKYALPTNYRLEGNPYFVAAALMVKTDINSDKQAELVVAVMDGENNWHLGTDIKETLPINGDYVVMTDEEGNPQVSFTAENGSPISWKYQDGDWFRYKNGEPVTAEAIVPTVTPTEVAVEPTVVVEPTREIETIDLTKNPEALAALSTKEAVEAWLSGKVVGIDKLYVEAINRPETKDNKISFGEVWRSETREGDKLSMVKDVFPAVILGVDGDDVVMGIVSGKGKKAVIKVSLTNSDNFGFFFDKPTVDAPIYRNKSDSRRELIAAVDVDEGTVAVLRLRSYMDYELLAKSVMAWPEAAGADYTVADRLARENNLTSDEVWGIKFMLAVAKARDMTYTDKELVDYARLASEEEKMLGETAAYIEGKSVKPTSQIIEKAEDVSTAITKEQIDFFVHMAQK